MKKFPLFFFSCILLIGAWSEFKACTRVVYQGPDRTIITARSMDWKDEIPANLWIFPRGMERTGKTGQQSVQWTSKYGSLISTAWDIASADGMNEKGLVANMLWLAESEYPDFTAAGNKKGLAISMWAQYFLDNFATVKEGVEYMKNEPFIIVSANIPNSEKFTTIHLSLSDSSGDNAILEYINGKLVIHHDPCYNVMTNSPIFEQQLALNTYWQGIPGTFMLPGTNRAADRFVRASYYINAIPQTADTRTAVASVFSVIRNCSVPYGITSQTEPNISSTRWRSVSDHKNLVYYFETVFTPNTFWVNLKEFDFSPATGKVMKLSLDNFQTYNGKTNKDFKETKPFDFLGV
ncbi:penicillin V acylase-like amidase (Ntn superfamily) [Chryseobacterium sp. H1D6B]|uniref:linear amide C-N hydrolase n=1 Tax=Chryseobacterium sp. H1D6B TaxID=2940588 RepID=UPI0015C85FB4|nr:linear amide C-N hydrolase [Chryseobacterium sp. H1D6B]MDH6250585.1 penicillin V acylase-like amidase (Ntn superfamily) [Chryseobacterium sp. H1D6B]